jgi:hypothetical protein
MGNFVLAGRVDGLGVRLNAVFNGLLIAELTGNDFRFIWPKTFLFNDEHHSIEAVNRVFSEKFIGKYLIDGVGVEGLTRLKFQEDDISGITSKFSQALAQSSHVVPQSSLFEFVRASDEVKIALAKRVCDKLAFSPAIENVRSLVNSLDLPSNLTAVHIRSGDIVYGRHSESPNFTDKVICAPAASGLVNLLKESGASVLLFGQEERTMHLLSEMPGVYNAASLYAGASLSRLESAMADVFLMMRCDRIYAENSGLPRLASQLGVKKIHSIFDRKSKREWANIIQSEIDAAPSLYTNEQISFSFYLIFDYLFESNDLDLFSKILGKAYFFSPGNLMFKFLAAINFHRASKFLECESLLSDLIDGVDLTSFESFSASRFSKMISRKSVSRSGRYAFDKYAPIFSTPASSEELVFSSALKVFFEDFDVLRSLNRLYKSIVLAKGDM